MVEVTSSSDITSSRKKQERRYVLCIVGMALVCLVVAVIELSFGASKINPIESVLALFGIGTPQDINTVQSIRLPRTVCAIVSGAGLALAGAALQSVLENPLASASTVGISQGAARLFFWRGDERHCALRVHWGYDVEHCRVDVLEIGICHARKHHSGGRRAFRLVGRGIDHHAVLLKRHRVDEGDFLAVRRPWPSNVASDRFHDVRRRALQHLFLSQPLEL